MWVLGRCTGLNGGIGHQVRLGWRPAPEPSPELRTSLKTWIWTILIGTTGLRLMNGEREAGQTHMAIMSSYGTSRVWVQTGAALRR
jgi:hypothetical protein